MSPELDTSSYLYYLVFTLRMYLLHVNILYEYVVVTMYGCLFEIFCVVITGWPSLD